MTKRVLMACLATLVFASRADAIPFFNVQLEANAVAISSDGVPGVDSQSPRDTSSCRSSTIFEVSSYRRQSAVC